MKYLLKLLTETRLKFTDAVWVDFQAEERHDGKVLNIKIYVKFLNSEGGLQSAELEMTSERLDRMDDVIFGEICDQLWTEIETERNG